MFVVYLIPHVFYTTPNFQQPEMYTGSYGTIEKPRDASKYGPQCLQGGTDDGEKIDETMNLKIEQFIARWLYERFDDLPLVRDGLFLVFIYWCLAIG